MNDFSPTPKKNRKGVIIAVIIALLLAGGAFFFFNRGATNNQQGNLTPTVSPTLEPTEEPTATPSGSITPGETSPTVRPTTGKVESATELNIQVLNGSGTVGAAAEVRDFLSNQGYENIDTGNADNYDYEGITINIKSSRQEFLTDIKSALEEKYTVGDSGTLSAGSAYDVVVIVGK
jgi:hypothetical protein